MKVCIVMPGFNEAGGIEEFISEITFSCKSFDPVIIFVNDSSTDNTIEVFDKILRVNSKVRLVNNVKNLGHGPSTLNALSCGVAEDADIVIAVDGDGQFLGLDIFSALTKFVTGQYEILEGVRQSRQDPIYRKITSVCTRLLIFSRCFKFPKDGNTPFRIYQSKILESLISGIDKSCTVPNLVISTKTRQSNLLICEFPVESILRRGLVSSSVSWGNRRDSIPSRKFIDFSLKAFIDFYVSTQSEKNMLLDS